MPEWQAPVCCQWQSTDEDRRIWLALALHELSDIWPKIVTKGEDWVRPEGNAQQEVDEMHGEEAVQDDDQCLRSRIVVGREWLGSNWRNSTNYVAPRGRRMKRVWYG
jgi:hypothetical protein